MTAPRPGAFPELPPATAHWTQEDIDAHEDWFAASDAFWREVGAAASRLVPVPDPAPEWIGGDLRVIRAVYEDRSYAWFGGGPDEDCDGPWACGDAQWVGGYRYHPDHEGELMTARAMVLVEEPCGVDEVARALARAYRELGRLEFTERC